MAATSELSAPDDRTVLFRLAKPFPHLPRALAGSSFLVPCIMPERLANTDPFRQVQEVVGAARTGFSPLTSTQASAPHTSVSRDTSRARARL